MGHILSNVLAPATFMQLINFPVVDLLRGHPKPRFRSPRSEAQIQKWFVYRGPICARYNSACIAGAGAAMPARSRLIQSLLALGNHLDAPPSRAEAGALISQLRPCLDDMWAIIYANQSSGGRSVLYRCRGPGALVQREIEGHISWIDRIRRSNGGETNWNSRWRWWVVESRVGSKRCKWGG